MYKVNKKNSPVTLGESNESMPEKAAFEVLKMVLVRKGIFITQSDIKLKPIDEDTFEFSFKGDDYVMTKNK